jgi:alpha-glucosidase/alpha-D-xyloside xylohydrolase
MNNRVIEPVAKQYAELRYQLLSYNYTLAEEACRTGMPMMRALWLHYPDDAAARGIGNQYLWGRDLLIAPVFTPNARSRDVYLPAGDWYDWWTGERIAGARTIARPVDLSIMPIYARAGAIIPWDPVRQYTGQHADAPLTLRVFTGADGEFTLYEDDGISLEDLQGRTTRTRFAWDQQAHTLTIQSEHPDPGPVTPETRELILTLLPDGVATNLSYQGPRRIIRFP